MNFGPDDPFLLENHARYIKSDGKIQTGISWIKKYMFHFDLFQLINGKQDRIFREESNYKKEKKKKQNGKIVFY